MKKRFELSPTNERNINKTNTLKLMGSPLSKKGTKITDKISLNLKLDKKSERITKNSSLEKANKKILNIITNCVEKIKDDKIEETLITKHLAGVIEKHSAFKDSKKNIRKEVHFENADLNQILTKKSHKTNKTYSKNNSSSNSFTMIQNNKHSSKMISDYIKASTGKIEKKESRHFKRIITSKFAKEKEKEIVYNISTSLISLYKPNINNYNISNYIKNIQKEPEKSKLINTSRKKSLPNINDRYQKTRKSMNDEKIRNSIFTERKSMKKIPKEKKFQTFIKHNNKIKYLKNKKKGSSLFIKNNAGHNNFQFKNDKYNSSCKMSSNINSNINTVNSNINSNINNTNIIEEKEDKNKRIKETFNPLYWANNLKNREDLTQGEYVSIGQDLRNSIIDYETKLEEEMKTIENTETTNLIRKLPTMRNKKNNKPSFSNSNFEDTLLNINITDLNLKSSLKFEKERFRALQHTGYVYDSLDDEEAEDAIDIHSYYIRPDSIFIYIFDSIIVTLSFYCLFYLPFYLAHDSFLNLSYFKFKILLFYIIDIFSIADLIISFFRGFYNYEEVLIKNMPEIVCHYFKNWFFMDVLSAIPFYSLIIFLENKNNIKINLVNLERFNNVEVKLDKMHYLLFLNKLLKIFKCFSDNNRALFKLNQLLAKNNTIEEKSDIFFIIFFIVVTMHFGTCIFIFIGRNSYPSWINNLQLYDESFSHIYICSLYYLITTITTVGYGDIYGRTIKEIIFQIILLIIGTCTYSYVISLVSNFIKKENEKSIIFENKLKILNEIKLTNPYLEDSLYEKLLRFLRYKKNTEKNKQTIIIDSLPYTLKNSLIIEMYKPIINNFIIFKGLQNSNCIVQLVKAFKPIYSIKNDILIQEGDFIEEIIFVKTGVISLEIGIDFNRPKESILQYLYRIRQKDNISFNSVKNNSTFNDTTLNGINETSFLQKMKTTIKIEKKDTHNMRYLKVLDIRKNEHFGETLMFFNERSFLNAKVKSKKAELFFLKKEEVIKIFNSFPNIWNRINKKSIYNMRQIKVTVRKVLLNFCNMTGINLDNSIKNEEKKASINNNSNKNKKKKKFEKNYKEKKSEDNSQFYNLNSLLTNNNENTINLSITKYKDDNLNDENSNKKENTNNNIISNLYRYSHSTDCEKKDIESPMFNINNCKRFNSNTKLRERIHDKFVNSKLINGFDSPYKPVNNSYKELGFSVNNISDDMKNSYISSKPTIRVSLNKKACTLVDSDSINEEKEISSDHYNINDEISKNEKFDLNCSFKNDLLKDKNNIISFLNNKLTIKDLYIKMMENTWVKNLDNEKYNYFGKYLKSDNDLIKIINKKSSSRKEDNNNNISLQSSIVNLETSDTESFEIQASYENINEITSNKYIKNKILRYKTKEFLLKECSNNLYEQKLYESRLSSEHMRYKSTVYENNSNQLKNLDKLRKMNSNISEIVPKKKKEIIRNIKTRGSMPSFKYKREGSTPKIKINPKLTLKNLSHFFNISQIDISKNNYYGKKKSKGASANNLIDIHNRSSVIVDDNISFYDKYNTNNNLSYDCVNDRQSVKKRKKQISELEKMKYVMEKDAQNLNQPALYYQQLFLNQIQRRKESRNINNLKSNEYTLLPRRNRNANNLSVNLDIKRTSTELKKMKNTFEYPLKKNNRISIFTSKLKKKY